MLDLFKPYRHVIKRSYTRLFFLTFIVSTITCPAIEYSDGLDAIPRSCEHEWVARYFNSLDEDVSIEEMVDFLIGLNVYLQAKGYKTDSLSEMCLNLRNLLIDKGIEIDDDQINEIFHEIVRRENQLCSSSDYTHAIDTSQRFNVIEIKKHKKKKELKLSNNFAKGFMKAFAGALLCIIPHPITLALGPTLLGDGLLDMMKHADDIPESNDMEERIKEENRRIHP